VLLDAGASSPTVKGKFIGTNVTSSVAPSNATGIEADGDNVIVGGTDPGDTNVISGNRDNGILDKGSMTALGNYIGTDRSGAAAIPNGFGINVATGGVATIGGTASGVGNLISGNGTGILARGNVTVLGNFIGTNISGTAAIANVYGINVSTGATGTIGGAVSGAGNLISGNSIGIELQGAGGITIQGNMIGTQANGTSPLGNTATGGGIAVEAQSNNVIGGTAAGEANVIAFNGNGVFMRYTSTHNRIKGNSIHDNLADGVYIEYAEAIDNTISRNSIYKNGTAGIDLADGANAGILPPVIAFASSSGASGTACANCTIEVFSDSDGQGRNFEGSVTAAGTGNWTFNGSISGPDVTATATDTAGNTSEFSQPFNIVSTPSPTPTGTAFIWGDNDCSGIVAGADALLDLLYSAGIQTASISSGNAADCTVGQSRAVGPATWGDVDCSGVIDLEDATDILAYIGGVSRPTPSGCPAIGSMLSPS
jgi:parallel beta-helix repeat protein